MAEKTTKELERLYTIPLRDVKSSPRNHRTDRALRYVRSYLQKHMKAEDVWIDQTVNLKLWERGMYQIPSKIRVRALKFDDGVVEVTLPEADVTSSLREKMKKDREAKTEDKEKKEKKGEEKGKPEKPSEKKEEAEAKKDAEAHKGKGEKKSEPHKAAEKKETQAHEKKDTHAHAEKPHEKHESKPAPKKESHEGHGHGKQGGTH